MVNDAGKMVDQLEFANTKEERKKLRLMKLASKVVLKEDIGLFRELAKY